eukprot:9503132-Pyramimonas_sp.AAC.1
MRLFVLDDCENATFQFEPLGPAREHYAIYEIVTAAEEIRTHRLEQLCKASTYIVLYFSWHARPRETSILARPITRRERRVREIQGLTFSPCVWAELIAARRLV